MRTHALRAALAFALSALSLVVLTGCSSDHPPGADESDRVDESDRAPRDTQNTSAPEDLGDDQSLHDLPADEHDTVAYDGPTVPDVTLSVSADPAGGINVSVDAPGFDVSPRAASTPPVPGQGHYSLYIDGEKLMRFYNDDIYVGGVVPGDITVRVELSANDHRAYTHDGEILAAEVSVTVPEHQHRDHSHEELGPIDFVGGSPTLSLEVIPDPTSGFNVVVALDTMVLSAEHASGAAVDGEGHLHLYVNGTKVGRLYGTATHLPVLPNGEVEVRVAAYSNDHRPYVVNGVPVAAAVIVEVGS